METSPSDFALMVGTKPEEKSRNTKKQIQISKIVTIGGVVAATILCSSIAILPLIPVSIYGLFTKIDPIERLYMKMFKKHAGAFQSDSYQSLTAKLVNLSWLLVIAVLFQTEYNIAFYGVVASFVAWSLYLIMSSACRINDGDDHSSAAKFASN